MTVRATYRFARLPEWVLYHPDLNGTDIRVFCALDRFDGADCFPALATLGARIGVSEDTARRSIRRLEAVGALRVEIRYPNGRQSSNRYLLAGDTPQAVDKSRVGVAKMQPPGVAKMPPPGVAKMPPYPEQEEREQEEREPHPMFSCLHVLRDSSFAVDNLRWPR